MQKLQKEEESLSQSNQRLVSEHQSLQEKLLKVRQTAQLETNSLKDYMAEQQEAVKRLNEVGSQVKPEFSRKFLD